MHKKRTEDIEFFLCYFMKQEPSIHHNTYIIINIRMNKVEQSQSIWDILVG